MGVFLMSLICYVLELVKVYVLYEWVMGYKRTKNKYVTLITIFLGIIAASISIIELKEYSVLAEVVVLFFSTLVLFQGSIAKKIIIFVPLYSFICLIDIWIRAMQQIVVHISNTDIFNIMVVQFFVSLITMGIFVILGKFRRKYSKEHFGKKLNWYQGVAGAIIIIISCIFMGYSQEVLEDTGSFRDRLLNLLFICAWVALVLIVFILIYAMIERERYKVSEEMSKRILESQQQYYDMILEKNESIRSFQHDYRNHLTCIKMFAQKDDNGNIIKYIEDMETITNDFSVNMSTGNDILDTVLNDVIQKYNGNKISFQISGALPTDFKVSNIDITTIFSNALINAVEANVESNLADKTIGISIRTIQNKCVIEMVNPIAKPLVIEDGIIRTTKRDKINHGFGIINIKNCLEKYKGIIEYERKENFIYTKIIV